jgi:hypothetical protein
MEFRVLGAFEVEDDGRVLAAEPSHHDPAELTTTPQEPSRESRDGPRLHRASERDRASRPAARIGAVALAILVAIAAAGRSWS